MSKINLFPYTLGEVSLHAKCEDPEIVRDSNIFEIYYAPDIKKFQINFQCTFDEIDKSIDGKELDRLEELCDPVLFIVGRKSLKRLSIKMTKQDSTAASGIYHSTITFDTSEWTGEVTISCFVILNKDLDQKYGYAYAKGSKLCLSQEFKILFDKPEISRKNKGTGIDILPISFSDPQYGWLNKYYADNIFAIDPTQKSKMPILYINADLDKNVMSLITNEQKGEGIKATARDLYFQTICNSVLNNLLSYSLTKLREEYDHLNPEDDQESIRESAWDELTEWQKNLIENYALDICPGSQEEDAKHNILESISEEKSFSELIRRLPNVVQNSLDTISTFEQTVRSINNRKKGKNL